MDLESLQSGENGIGPIGSRQRGQRQRDHPEGGKGSKWHEGLPCKVDGHSMESHLGEPAIFRISFSARNMPR